VSLSVTMANWPSRWGGVDHCSGCRDNGKWQGSMVVGDVAGLELREGVRRLHPAPPGSAPAPGEHIVPGLFHSMTKSCLMLICVWLDLSVSVIAFSETRWRNPDLPEVIEFLSHPSNNIKANAAAYLQHLTYQDDDIKGKTRWAPPIFRLSAWSSEPSVVTLYAVITPCAFQILRIRGCFLALKRARAGANRPPHTLLITQ
jgi:hypothetical protein